MNIIFKKLIILLFGLIPITTVSAQTETTAASPFFQFIPLITIIGIIGIIYLIVHLKNKNNPNKLSSLGGWLILVGIGVVTSPFKVMSEVIPVFIELFESGNWEIMTTPGTTSYHPFWSSLIIGEILVNSIFIIASFYLIALFFTKKKNFPKWYIGICLFSLLIVLIDSLLLQIILPNEPFFDLETIRAFLPTLLTLVIWGPYLLFSKRVKATFIK